MTCQVVDATISQDMDLEEFNWSSFRETLREMLEDGHEISSEAGAVTLLAERDGFRHVTAKLVDGNEIRWFQPWFA